MPKVIAFETTTVAADKTAAEIEDLLRRHNAAQVSKRYENGRVAALAFSMETPEGKVPFQLPVNVDAVYQLFLTNRQSSPVWSRRNPNQQEKEKIYAQAERTAWRTAWWWIKGQLDYIRTQMVTITQVFMPYMLVGPDETAYQRLMERGLPALEAPREDHD